MRRRRFIADFLLCSIQDIPGYFHAIRRIITLDYGLEITGRHEMTLSCNDPVLLLIEGE